MQLRRFFALVALATTVQSALATPPDDWAYINEVTALLPSLEANADVLWPGLSAMNSLPVIVASYTNATYGLRYHPSQPDTWQVLTSNGYPVYYRQAGGNAFILQQMARTSFIFEDVNYDNQRVIADMVSLTKDGQPEINSFLTTYFAQYEFGVSPMGAVKRQLLAAPHAPITDFKNPELLTLLALQFEVMRDYLKTDNLETLKDYVALFRERYARLDENTRQVEYGQQDLISLLGYPLFGTFANGNQQLDKTQLLKLMENSPLVDPEPSSESIMGYQSVTLVELGAASLYALDKVNPQWKQLVETTNVGPSRLLAESFTMSSAEQAQRVARVKKARNAAQIQQQFGASLVNEKLAAQRYQQFLADKSVALTMDVPSNFVSGFYYDWYENNSALDSQTLYKWDDNAEGVFNFQSYGAEQLNVRGAHFKHQAMKVDDHLLNSKNGLMTVKWLPTAVITLDGATQTLAKLIAKGPVTYTLNQFTIKQGEQTLVANAGSAYKPFTLQVTATGIHLSFTLSSDLGVLQAPHKLQFRKTTPKQRENVLIKAIKGM